MLELNEQIHDAMKAKGVSRSELADRLGTSRAFITKLLSGHENVTLKTLVRVANALDCSLEVSVRGRATGKAKSSLAASETRRNVRVKRAS
jgi:transcriptional regulator with XRE-family HTH domain